MNQSRRIFLKGTLAAGVVTVAAGAGLLVPTTVLASWPKTAFEATSIGDAVKILTGTDALTESADVTVNAPDIAENGALVPITAQSSLPDVESISILVMENARPLCVTYDMTDKVNAYVSTRIKMGKTSEVLAAVKAGGKVYSGKKLVKVTLGGCGG